ncbi:MAG TPA: transposase [Ktedonobacteraceae bacterium]|nr:transposase [Ktedonobacteraceae bacterium]
MPQKRKEYTAEFKAKVVLESFQRDTTIEAVRTKFSVSNSMIHRWREEFKTNLSVLFGDKRNPKAKAQAQGYLPGESPDDLKKIIGDLTVQLEILKKVQGLLGH